MWCWQVESSFGTSSGRRSANTSQAQRSAMPRGCACSGGSQASVSNTRHPRLLIRLAFLCLAFQFNSITTGESPPFFASSSILPLPPPPFGVQRRVGA